MVRDNVLNFEESVLKSVRLPVDAKIWAVLKVMKFYSQFGMVGVEVGHICTFTMQTSVKFFRFRDVLLPPNLRAARLPESRGSQHRGYCCFFPLKSDCHGRNNWFG